MQCAMHVRWRQRPCVVRRPSPNVVTHPGRHFQRDLYAATELLTDPARLKAAVMELHRRHGGRSAAAGGVEEVQGEQPALGTQPSNGAVSATASEAKCAPSAAGCRS